MITVVKKWQFLPAALYAWIVTAFFGATVLDIVYARLAARLLEPSDTSTLFTEGADLLLCLGALAVLAGLVAICSSWTSPPARNLFIASVLILIFEFLTPMLFFLLIWKLHVNPGVDLGMWIRLVESASSSILAFIGIWKLRSSTA
jgi:hypothetical protein